MKIFQELEKALRPETVLVSIMTVNNEIGVKQPIEAIGNFILSFLAFFNKMTWCFLVYVVD